MTQLNTLNGQGAGPGSTFKPRIVARKPDAQVRYEAALELVARIDEHLTRGTRHYRTKSGELLRTLDQVVNAILTDNLLLDADAPADQNELARAA